MPEPDLSVRPAIGFVMWHLAQGATGDEVYELLVKSEQGRDLSDRQRSDAISQARSNLSATQRLKTVSENAVLAEQFRGTLISLAKIGVRVKLWLRYPDGRREEVSVTINVDRYTTKGQALQMALDFYRSGAFRARWKAGYEGEIELDEAGRELTAEGESTVEIVALLAGGLPNPAVGPPMLE